MGDLVIDIGSKTGSDAEYAAGVEAEAIGALHAAYELLYHWLGWSVRRGGLQLGLCLGLRIS